MAWYNSSWQYRVKITIDHTKVDSTLTDFPVYVDLSNLPSGFHTNVKSDGGDIRVTRSDGTTECAREVVFYDSTTDTGELHFKANSISSSVDTDFYIYYGNSSATEPASNATYGSENVWTNNFSAVWHFNNDFSDSTSSGYDGTNSGTSDVSGKIGRARDFVRSEEDYIDINSDCGINYTTGAWSVSGWFNVDDLTNASTIVGWGSGDVTPYYYWMVVVKTDGALEFWAYDGANHHVDTATSLISANTDYYFTVNYDNDSISIYVNGSSRATGTVNTADRTDAWDEIRIGHKIWTTEGNYADAQIDEIRMRSTTTSLSLHSAEYNNQNSPSTFYTVGSVATTVNDSRNAKITGKDTSINERSAKISGRKLSYHTKGDKTTLPTTSADLDTLYTDQEEIDVSTDNGTYVNVEGSNYLIHQHAKVNSNKSALSIKWNGQSTLAPSSSTVYLQIYNFNTNSWETLSSNNSASANTDFNLTGSKTTNLTYYYDSDNYCYVRVYQNVS